MVEKAETKEPTTAPEVPFADQHVEEHDDTEGTGELKAETKEPVEDKPEPTPEPVKKDDHITLQSPTTLKAKIKRFIKAWWNNPKARWGTIAGLAVVLLVIGIIPTSRYFVLNTVGVRASASVTVLDESTQQPLKNVQVSLAGQSAKTDNNGTAKVQHIKLGRTILQINRVAFAQVNKPVTIGLGSNPLGTMSIQPTGEQYTFVVTDFLSTKPINDAEAINGESEAIGNENGEVRLTLDDVNEQNIEVTIKAEGYRDEVLSISPADKSLKQVQMVPARKHAYISKRSGKYDVYASNVDGKNETLLLAGSGYERNDLVLAPNPSSSVVAFASTRDNVRNKDGYLLTTLSTIDTQTGQKTDLGQSERIQLVDWIGDRLVYVQVAAGASANNPNRQRLISYDVKTGDRKELASSNYFNDVLTAAGAIYYAPSDYNQSSPVAFYKLNADGTGKQNLLNKPTWNIFRIKYDQLNLSVAQDWYDYKLGNAQAAKISGPPADLKNRLYRDSADRQFSLWVDSRDGKGVLLNYDVNSKQDKILRTQSGLSNPISWLNKNYIIYRINTDQETADYVLNLEGGEPRKIKDVTNTNGLDQWYYYQ